MGKSLTYLLLIIITAFSAAGVYLYKPISGVMEKIADTGSCSEPMTIQIGQTDARFAISAEEITAAADDAARIWNSGSKQTLFNVQEDSPTPADITIHFKYDERQQRTDAEYRYRERIRSEQIRLEQLRAQHDRRRDRFQEESIELQQLSEQLGNKLTELNNWVSEKNDAGGFTEAEYSEFKKKKAAIEKRQRFIRQKRAGLESMARTINREMEDLNAQFNELNRMTDRYNEDFAGKLKFTKATYQNLGESGVITVSQFMNQGELILIIAHELGHALGINHLQNPESVMHSHMGEQRLFPEVHLTDEDRRALMAICR